MGFRYKRLDLQDIAIVDDAWKCIMKLVFMPQKTLVSMKNGILIGLFLLVAVGLVFFLRPKNNGGVKTSRVSRDNVSEVVAGSDSVKLTGVNEVYSLSTGVIKEIYVAENELVRKGQKLFSVEGNSSQTERANAYLAYTTSVSNLKSAEQAKKTLQGQLESGRKAVLDAVNSFDQYRENSINQKNNPSTNKSYTDAEKLSIESNKTGAYENFSALEKKYLEADDAIKAARAAVSANWLSYQATQNITITAPVDGTVINFFRRKGDNVDIQSSGDRPVLYIGQSDEFKVIFHVSEYDIQKVQIGQKAKVNFDALPDSEFEAEVVSVDLIGNRDRGSVTFDVAVVLQNSQDVWEKIKPEMTANVEIMTKQRNDVLTIPRSSLRLEKGRYYVVKMIGKKKVETEIKTGVMGSDKVEVTGGLSEGDEVLSIFEMVK